MRLSVIVAVMQSDEERRHSGCCNASDGDDHSSYEHAVAAEPLRHHFLGGAGGRSGIVLRGCPHSPVRDQEGRKKRADKHDGIAHDSIISDGGAHVGLTACG